MPKTVKKLIRCPYHNKNIYIAIDFENDEFNEEVVIGMTCIERDLLEKSNKSCNTMCEKEIWF